MASTHRSLIAMTVTFGETSDVSSPLKSIALTAPKQGVNPSRFVATCTPDVLRRGLWFPGDYGIRRYIDISVEFNSPAPAAPKEKGTSLVSDVGDTGWLVCTLVR